VSACRIRTKLGVQHLTIGVDVLTFRLLLGSEQGKIGAKKIQ
jgi:hypothetical protein